MRKPHQLVAMLSLWAALFGCSAASYAAPEPVIATKEMETVSGRYYLQGVREVGSELLLRKDGQFRWSLSYGATDKESHGTWQMKGNELDLTSANPASGFKTLKLTLDQGKLVMNDPATGMKGDYVKQP